MTIAAEPDETMPMPRRPILASMAIAVHHAVKTRSGSRGNFIARICNLCAYHRLRVAFQLFCIAYLVFAGFILLFHQPHARASASANHFDLRRTQLQQAVPLPLPLPLEEAVDVNPNTAPVEVARPPPPPPPPAAPKVAVAVQPPQHRTPPAPAPASVRKAPSPPKGERPSALVLGFSVHGGVGNQIYDMLEALYLARHVRSVLLVPAVLPRHDVEGAAEARNGARVWDLKRMQAGTRGQPVLPHLPRACRGRIHVLYLFLRRNAAAPTPLGEVPNEVRHGVCALASATPGFRRGECKSLFDSTIVRIRRQNLTIGGDDSFIRELRILGARAARTKSPLCVWVSGHSYDRGGAEGDEYLYAHMHFLEAHARLVAAARTWPLNRLAVVHVRYDEELCDSTKHNATRVCVRVHKDGARNPKPAVYWAPIDEYATLIGTAAARDGATHVYIAASPYVPVETVMALRRSFSSRGNLRVTRMASDVYEDEADLNFLERELAIRAKVFVGDFGSTWSGTVYFKRRTQGNTSLWANILLGKANNLGYYAHNTPLQIPD